MKKFVALLMMEKRLGRNGKMMTPTFFEFYIVYIYKKIRAIFSHTLLAIHLPVAIYNYFKKLISEV